MSKNQTLIRKATLLDSNAIADIHVKSRQKVYRGIIPDAVLDALSVQEREAVWHEIIDSNTVVLVIEHKNVIIGFASMAQGRDLDLDPTIYGEISAIYLHPDYFHQGFGRLLMQHATEKLEDMGFSFVYAWVLTENIPAKKFYEAMGFEETNVTKADLNTTETIILNEVRYLKKLASVIDFKPLAEEDLDLLCDWFAQPHVKQWWDDHLPPEGIKSKYRERIGNAIIAPFIVYYRKKPIGFIQYYNAEQIDNNWWLDETQATLGLDQFIGEKDYLNRGIGTLMIREFVHKLFSNPDIKRIVVDVDPVNKRAIKCYENVGFQFVKELMTPDGRAYLMKIKKT